MLSYAANLEPRIRSILQSSDLNTISAKGVRKQLVAAGEDESAIKEHKADIDAIIGEIYEELCDAEEDKVKTKPESASPPASSQPLAGRAKAEDNDAELAARMQAEYDAAVRGGRGARRTAAPAPKKKKAKKRKADSDDDEPKKKRAGGGGGAFNKPMILSHELASFTGEEQLSRPQTVKALWAHIKAHDLQDPSDKRFILCDDKMKALFKTDRLHMFTMNKLLGEHLYNPDDVAGKVEKVEKAEP
ncbi:SWIB-domain-containing protein [Cutaneotrichosporon oleaginosum]|uniref:SWIB-domain-containing protein n=1 Tax=Cutaneotrichosporon oleaginosum TaxID=879819 RepID=A0A0J1B9E9_9TREE|nr:SWIB-domain-containing protein [Cutaneotrichosporon oleaginosum]KLT44454.1 SWIB-domain-containing protein [Cutaneotrichosporon oleaginosum]